MMWRALMAAVAVSMIVVGSALAHEEEYIALLSGPAEHPPNASPGIGVATLHLDLDLATMLIETSFSGLLGTTTVAHIHAPTDVPFTGPAGVATQLPSFVGFPAGVTSGTYDHTFDLADSATYNPSYVTANGGTVSGAMNALIFALRDGKAYLNIHTSAFPGGEIRGFFVPVPEPSTWALLVLGVVGLSGLAARGSKHG